jgi:phosphatidylserine/phosphatidylglycerophosphate/cardiolipin synthase-like enzyme
VKLIIEPADGVLPLLAAIKSAKTRVEIAIFRFDRTDVEMALKAAAERGVKVNVLIAFANRGGEQRLRTLELRCLDAGIIVARTSNDLTRYHGKYILIDRRTLYVLSFNFTHLDIDHSRGFGIATTHANWVREAARLFRADCTRSKYEPKTETFVVSPANSRKALDTFLKKAKTELLIYDPRISDKGMLRTLQGRAKAGVEIKVIGSVARGAQFDVRKLTGKRLHTRTIIRDRRQAFVGSQSLRAAELDSRRELGLIVQDARVVKTLVDTFESDWAGTNAKKTPAPSTEKAPEAPAAEQGAVSTREAEKAVQVLKKELDPLAVSVKKAVRKAVAKAGEDVLRDTDVKDTMKKVVKRAVKDAVKEAVKEAVHDAKKAQDVKEARAVARDAFRAGGTARRHLAIHHTDHAEVPKVRPSRRAD